MNKDTITLEVSIVSLRARKVYDFQLPVPSYINCRNSSHGWLVLVEECPNRTNFPVYLFNPFRSNQNKIHLPPLSTFSTVDPYHNPLSNSFFLKKAVFSRNPSMSLSSLNESKKSITNDDDDNDDKELVVFGLTVKKDIEFCRVGDRAWTPLLLADLRISFVADISFYKGQLWGVLYNGAAGAFDIVQKPKFTIVVNKHPDECMSGFRYLVESTGDLFQVRKDLVWAENGYHSTLGFEAFKLNSATMKWVKTNTLDGRMFFLGDNASMSFAVADGFPGWCKPNSIYFTDDHSGDCCCQPWAGHHDMGVFNLEDGSFEQHYTIEDKPTMPAPIWIQPML